MSDRVVEVTAPICLSLAELGPLNEPQPGREVAVRLSLDRRVSCVARPCDTGLIIESRDSGEKLEAGTLAELAELAEGSRSLVVEVLRHLGISGGVRISTHTRVPLGAGLAVVPALAATAMVAVATLFDRELQPEEASRLAASAAAKAMPNSHPTGEHAYRAPFLGGIHAAETREGSSLVRPLSVDPARVEECLCLVDLGTPLRAGGSERGAPVPSGQEQLPGLVAQALEEGRFDDVTALLGRDWDATLADGRWSPEAEVLRIAELARAAGGAIRPCAPGHGGLALVWAVPGSRSPGPRERLDQALRDGGVRQFPVRVDLLGLAVD